MMFLAFLCGFLACVLVGVALKWLLGYGEAENGLSTFKDHMQKEQDRALACLEKTMKAEMDSRLFTLAEQWNTKLRSIEQQLEVKVNPFVPSTPDQIARDIRDAKAAAIVPDMFPFDENGPAGF